MSPQLAPPVCRPHIADMEEIQDALRKVLDAIPASTRALAREAGVSPKLLRMIRDGERRLTPQVRDELVAALRRWEAQCGDAAEALEAADLEPSQGGDDA